MTYEPGIYRLFDRNHQLLYIGKSVFPQRRIADHKRDKSWAGEVRYHRITRCGYAVMHVEEKMAIISEKPKYNVQRYKYGIKKVYLNWSDQLRHEIEVAGLVDDILEWTDPITGEIYCTEESLVDNNLMALSRERIRETIIRLCSKKILRLRATPHRSYWVLSSNH